MEDQRTTLKQDGNSVNDLIGQIHSSLILKNKQLEICLSSIKRFLVDTEWTLEMNTEYKVKLTPKDDKVIDSQNLPMPILLKGNLIGDYNKQIWHHQRTTLLQVRTPEFSAQET